jgi:DNA-binding NarL/FixJ family response regulator
VQSVFVVSTVAIYREGIAAYLADRPGLTVAGVADSLTFDAGMSDVCVVDRANLAFDDFDVFFDAMQQSQTPVVVIGVRREDGDVLTWLEAGASGYVTREESLADLHRAIVETLEFGARVEPDDVPVVLLRLRHHTRIDHRRTTGAADALTLREREVAGLMCRHLSNKQIASELGISIHTAKHHVRAALAKLGVDRRVHVARALSAADPTVQIQ